MTLTPNNEVICLNFQSRQGAIYARSKAILTSLTKSHNKSTLHNDQFLFLHSSHTAKKDVIDKFERAKTPLERAALYTIAAEIFNRYPIENQTVADDESFLYAIFDACPHNRKALPEEQQARVFLMRKLESFYQSKIAHYYHNPGPVDQATEATRDHFYYRYTQFLQTYVRPHNYPSSGVPFDKTIQMLTNEQKPLPQHAEASRLLLLSVLKVPTVSQQQGEPHRLNLRYDTEAIPIPLNALQFIEHFNTQPRVPNILAMIILLRDDRMMTAISSVCSKKDLSKALLALQKNIQDTTWGERESQFGKQLADLIVNRLTET